MELPSNLADIVGRLEPKPDTIYFIEVDLPPDAQKEMAQIIKNETNGKVMFLIFHPGIIRSLNEMTCEQLANVRDSVVEVCNMAIEIVQKWPNKSPEQCDKEDAERAAASNPA